jgi:hypothetical protein
MYMYLFGELDLAIGVKGIWVDIKSMHARFGQWTSAFPRLFIRP